MILVTLVVVSSFVVYATYVDRTVYTTESLVIIPESVTSDSWLGLESVLVQDISEYSLYQDFDKDNSAFVSELGLFSASTSENAPTPQNPNQAGTTTDVGPVPEQSNEENVTAPSGTDLPVAEQAPQTSEQQVETSVPPELEPVVPQPEPEIPSESETQTDVPVESTSEPTTRNNRVSPLVWGVFESDVRAYPLAQGVIDEPVTANEVTEPEPVVESTQESSTDVLPDEPITELPANGVTGADENVQDGLTSESVSESPVEVPGTPFPEESVLIEESATGTSEGEVISVSETEVEPDVPVFTLEPCESALGCSTNSMIFTGFAMPDFEDGSVLDSAQLRLSLAAQTKENRGDGPQRFLVEYSYDVGTGTKQWATAQVIDIDDEISNSINGGYFLISLDTPPSAAELSNLSIKLSYQGNVTDLKTAYVEAIWLEVTSGEFFEEGVGDVFTDTIDYNRNLLQPEINTLNRPDLDPALSRLPSFTLSYDPQGGFFGRLFRTLFSENTFAVDRITLTDKDGLEIPVPFKITYNDRLTWTMDAIEMPQKLQPGKYTVSVSMLENGDVYTDAFEFYWGLLAVNTKKSMYAPNESVEFNLAALTDQGDTICDAKLELKIINPKNEIFEVPVEQSGACGDNNVTDIPDYIAKFTNTGEWGLYKIQLQHLNQAGEVVHKIEDSFEVRDYIPFDITRTAPTRIYPPSPYAVKLDIKANRDFTGDITERVPRGFLLSDFGDAEISSLPEYTLLTWKNISLVEGDSLNLSYTFDAPDVSPYMYLLGPLDMDGFTELRQWQIASDALTNVAWLTGTQTLTGANLNGVASPLLWSTSSVDTYYFTHSTSSNSQRMTFRRAGDYMIAVTLPQQRTDANNSRTRVGVEVRVNGVAVPQGLGRSGLIENQGNQSESSSHTNFLLTGIAANDYVEVFAQGIATVDVGDIVNVSGRAAMYVEYVSPTKTVFAATTTRTASSTNLNQTAASALEWIETRQNSGFVHSNVVNPQNITISNPGTYQVQISVPLNAVTGIAQTNVMGRVRLNGVQVPGGIIAQGYLAGEANESDADSSMHWSGIIVATTSNQVLTITTEAEASAGTTTVPTGFVGSVYIEPIPATETIVLRGRNLTGGTDWSNSPAEAILWDTQVAYSSTTFTHSTTTNNSQITVNTPGDYLLTYTDSMRSTTQRANNRITVTVNGVTVSGAETKSHFMRNTGGHGTSSGAMTYLLEGVTAGQIVRVFSEQEAGNAVIDDTDDAVLMLTKKADINFEPLPPTTFNVPFNNIRFASTSPYFEFQANDPDGTSDIAYEFAISTSSDFSSGSSFISSSSPGFVNTITATDTSPFFENQKIRYQLQASSTLTDLTTYYWRVRAADATGSGNFGDWTTTQNLTVDLAASAPNWYQTFSGQFLSNTLVGAVSTGVDSIQVDATKSTELLLAYGEGVVSTPRYRLWNGTTWGAELNALAVGGTINWVKTAAGVTRNEYALATLDQAANTYVQIYTASTSSWSNQTQLAGGVADVTRRGIALSYESLSGDLIAVSCASSSRPVFRVWNGVTWSATSTITVSSVNNCNYLDIASDPSSDEMILVVRDTGVQYEALVWDGSTWTNSKVLGSAALAAREGIAIQYEASGNQAVVIVSNGANNNILYTTWDGVGWSSNATQPIGNDFAFGKLTSDPSSDKLTLCYVDADSDIGVLRWDGGVWSTFFELETAANSATARPFDCPFETAAGRSGYIMVPYSDTTDSRFRVFATSTWTTEATITGVSDSFWINSERSDDGVIVSINLDDATDVLESSFWNGTTWSSKQTIEASPSSIIAAPYEMFDITAKRFQFTSGVVLTPAISFSFVPNQPTWGDVSFSTTEPFGTDVKVKFKFTSTTTCDSYIPNGALTGNSAGFDVTNSPISLVGLSTTTYNQICMEATLTTLGSASANLNDWTLSWVREPKLIQNNYRWFTNGSFLTPTDPWPAGVSDVPENTAITSNLAINSSNSIRLRMSLLGSNVVQPTSTKAFKLQYAEGLSCSPTMSWQDVGAVGSTTATWRGFANTIIGSDWYSASWLRRTKISIPNALVSSTSSDFPVYVNLNDLSATFFDYVKSNGADIRVTRGDGITEVPFELVSINTTTDTGELHFKGYVSATSSTDYYIYYANPAASAYAANATFGSQNVWTNSYLGVYHMNQDPSGSAPQILDSTAAARHATRTGTATSGRLVSTQIGNGLDFLGSGDYSVDFPSFSLGSASSYTYSGWFRSGAFTNGAGNDGAGTYFVDRTIGGNPLVSLKASGGNYMHQYRNDSGSVLTGLTSSAIATTTWQYVSWGRDNGANIFLSVNNAFATTSDAALGALTPATLVKLGGHNGNTDYNGRADEMRFSSVARSQAWRLTEFNNQSNPNGFTLDSAEEIIGDGRTLTATVLTGSDYAETYEEFNPTNSNRNAIATGTDAEWDFSLQNNGATSSTNYCFRMAYADGSSLSSYVNYPKLITNAPPLQPSLSAPFDNRQLASSSPWFEFTAEDELSDDVSYEIEVDDDINFGSPSFNRNSGSNFSLFTNLANPSQRNQYTSGQTMRFIPNVSLSNGTYWWRVRAKDDFGSNTNSAWSNPYSFTIASTSITTWFQTTGDQFITNNQFDTTVSTTTNDTGIDGVFINGTTTSTVIDYDNRETGNAWGIFSFNNNITSGSIRYYIEYRVGGDTFALIPDSALPGNSSGFTSSPVSLITLSTTIYNEIRMVAAFSGNSTLPRLLDWTVTWGLTIEAPTQSQPFDNAKSGTTTPSFTFVTTDPQNDDLQYELQLSTTYDFAASSTFTSGVSAGFSNSASSSDVSPFTSGNAIRYVAQSALINGTTYWWRTRARDPGGSNSWSTYSEQKSFTIDTAITTSVWHQTTGEQFATNDLVDIETTAGTAKITSVVSEVLMAYGEGTGQSPRYRVWNGSSWSATGTAGSVGAQIRWLDLEASPTRPEYALASLGTDLDVNIQIFNTNTEIWGNTREIQQNITDGLQRGFDVAYEKTSGDLIAVSCDGVDAVYSVWNGTTWSATTSINLANANNCIAVDMAPDTTSDEIIAVFKHTNTSTPDYEALVWNGSSWGNSLALADMNENANHGVAIEYEESGNQAVVALTNNLATTLLYATWSGSAWATSTAVLGDHIEWASLKRDVGTDNMALCYIDNDANIGVLFWNGSAWGTFTEIEQLGNSKAGQAVDCEYETKVGRDGYLNVQYADTIIGAYQFYATSSFSVESQISTMGDSWRVLSARAGDGTIHTVYFEDVLDRYELSRFDGSTWSTTEPIASPSIVGTPFDGSLALAAQIYPNFTSGSVISTPVNFSDGAGPRWERVTFSDTKPGASTIKYRLYYESTPGVYSIIPDSALTGNAAGFTTSPINIAGLDRTIYAKLKLDAEFICNLGNCPTLNDWSVEWSQGISVSGRAYEYDGVSTTTSGTVAVAVNGALQVGKTGTIAVDGTWSIANVTAFEGDTIVVYVDGAVDSNESIGITTYDGVGDVTNVELTKRHVTVGSNDTATTTNSRLFGFDGSDDEDLFIDITAGGVLDLCFEGCSDGRLKIKSGTVYQPQGNVLTHDLFNFGTFRPGTSTIRVRGSWNSVGTLVPETSTVLFVATTSVETVTASGTAISFNNVTFGETSSAASWTLLKALDITGSLTANHGTLARGTTTINLEQNLSVGASGTFSGVGTTTFDGSGSHIWTDNTASTTNVGDVVIDGAGKTITLGSNVAAQSITIGADDTLNASGSGFNINVLRNWTNANSFIPQSGTVTFMGTTSGTIARGTSVFNNLTFSGVGGAWSFSTSTLAINSNLTIATGTVTLPTGTTTIAGSFLNTGGTFAHNNGEVRMTSTVAGRSITQRASAFLNAFYDLVFTGSGAWSYTESAATTTRNMYIQTGTVTLAGSTLTVGGDFSVTGSGAFAHNSGELVLLVQGSNVLRTNGSSINNLRTRGNGGSWYNSSWNTRKPVVVSAVQVSENVTNFPVFVNLNNLGSDFFSTVKSDGGDIRVTTSDGVTEVPIELVAINTGAQTGELHFKAPTLSTSSNSTFYVYYGNSGAALYASSSTFGAQSVWTNGYAAVYHLNQDPTGAGAIMLDSTVNARNGTRSGTAAAGRLISAKVGFGLNMVGTAGDYAIDFPAPGIVGTSSFTFSGWFLNGTITSGLNTDANGTYMVDRTGVTNELAGLKVIGGNYAHQFRYGDASGIGSVNGTAATSTGWQNVVWGRTYNSNRFVYVDKTGATTTDNASALIPPGPRLGGHQSNTIYDGVADEFRISNVARSAGWISTEYNNQASTTNFYAVSAAESRQSRVFTDTNATILGNFILDTGGESTFPTGVLSIAGSFDNNATFGSNSGTVRFNSTGGAETIAAGSSTFATVDFNSSAGDFTVTENATATVAFNLTNIQQFTLQSGRVFETTGTFTHAASGTATTWTGSTLRLSGSDSAINLKTHGGDVYGTIQTSGDTDAIVWNSSATSIVNASTSSLYSADHAGIDGDLTIYGDYVRTTGTEFWSLATDFDGVALTGSTSRQVDVRIATGSRVGFVSSSLNLVGGSGATTTIDAVSGAYSLSATNTTITAQAFSLAGTDTQGLVLQASTTLASFQDGLFTVIPGRSGITISSTTVAQNPSAQYQRISFATTSAGVGTNVTLVGTTSSFIWFRTGGGNLYGEAYDGGDANPGSIRWDDSSNSITVSGVVYSNDGTTILGAPTCNGTTPNVRIVVNNGTYTASTTCAVGTGAYSFAGVTYVGDPKITVYLDTNGGVRGTAITKTPTANITNMHIYADRIITRHQDVVPLTISDMTTFDFDDDTDIRFIATTTGSTTLTVLPNTSLFVFATTTFAPGGNITLTGNASSSAVEGTLQLANAATFTATGTEMHSLSGRLVLATTSVFTAASSTFVFNATTSGKSITSPNTVTFNQLQFTGAGGGWNITAPLIVQANMDIATGTVTGTNNITLTGGSLSGNGTLSLGSGTTTINQTNTLGGTRAWTFANLVLGNGSSVGTTTPNTSATTTVSGRLTISNVHVLKANATLWDLSGTGTVFTETGTLVEDTSTFRYSGTASNVLSTGYYNLDLNSGAGSATYTAVGLGISVANNLTIGGTATTNFNLTINDPLLVVGNDILIRSNGTLTASDIATTTVARDWMNTGAFISNSGTVTFVGTGSSTIIASSSSFGNLTINGAGSFTVASSATTTGAFTLTNHANFTLSSGRTLAIGGNFTNGLGGGATTWTGSTLHLFGGNTKVINASTTSDVYETLSVAAGTNVRIWNSSATTYNATGGIYSQDHAGSNGALNVYGAFTSNTLTDHWSYATDFDGTSLAGSERAVTVSFASSSSATYTGGNLFVVGTTTASTTVQNQGVGRYTVTIGTGATTQWDMVRVRNTNTTGIVFTGTPLVTDFSRTDHIIDINSGTAFTVGGTVIDVNQAKNFTNNVFATSSGITSASNVTATGTTVSSWRFTNHTGALSGELYDSDPAGDPGYLVWDNSAALITVSGNVYSDEGSTVSTVCDGTTQNVVLRVAGLTTYTSSCNAGTGAYSMSGVAFSPSDTLTVYIDGNTRKAATVSSDPISSIGNMNLYENRVIVRHENTSPLLIADMAVWDSSDDADIQFTAIDAGTHTLTLPADQKLLIWNGKTFEPNGNVTVSGGGAGGAQDGTLEAQTNAVFRAQGTEQHTVGGSFIFGTGATFVAAQSSTTFTTTGSGRTVDVNAASFGNVAFTGSGSWTVTDATFTTSRSFTQTNGTVTFGAGTTTVGRSFNATAGTFIMSGSALVFVSTTTGNVVRFDDSSVPGLQFVGTGGAWAMTDTDATTTGSFAVASGTVTLPSGNLTVSRNFTNTGGTITNNTADIIMAASSSATLTASGSSLFAVRFTGIGPFTIGDVNLTLLDSLTLATGTLTLATGTLSVGGDFLIASGTLNNASGTVLFNAATVGKTITFGANALYNVVFGSGTGGWNFTGNATTTNNFSITGATSFTKEADTTLNVGGVFTNLVGGANTTWATSTLRLYGTAGYTLNTKTVGGDVYGTLFIGTNLPVRSWNSSAATTTVSAGSSWYSQDHAAVDGNLNIYGSLTIATTTEYWNYSTDFDGAALTGVNQRAVAVRFAQNATTTVASGALQIVGTTTASTTIGNQATGTYALSIQGGTFTAQYYAFSNLNASGLQFVNTPTISNLSNGYFNLAVNSGSLISLATTSLDANASKIWTAVAFNATSGLSGTNVNLSGSSSNAWRFSGSYGNLGGEDYDNDGATACGSIRWDNSGCLLTQQSYIRWRNDDGGEGAPQSEWFNTSFDYRKRVRVVNSDASNYASTAVKINVTYDSNMQSDFDDLRFTANDGTTTIPYWIERYTASTDAVVWVRVPNIAASSIATVFMYYGSSTAPNSSSGSTTFAVFDDFEDNNITEYAGDTGIFQTDTTPVYGGTYALEALNKSARATDGIFRTALTVSQGQIIRWMQYIDTVAGSGDEACTLFGVQSPGTNNNNYAVCLEQFGTDRIAISENVSDNDVSGTVLSSTTVSYTTGWYEVEVDWQTNNTMKAYLRTAAGALVASTTATDASYTTGGMGFTFWFQNGSWDSFTARARAMIAPTVYFGDEQTDGGATWAAAQNALGSGIPGTVRRLRVGIENSGLNVTGQTYRLEYAGKGVAPSCEAVSSGSYTAVPNQASCGSSPVCMQTSTNVTDGDATTDLLSSTTGAFTAGRIVESPSNITSALNINQNFYTELEYAITPTVNASDAYCFRVTNGGTPLDFYNKIAELGLQFDPVFGPVSVNNGNPIILNPGTTTAIFATGTVTDFNGPGDLQRATSTLYRSSAGPSCVRNNNNCYISNTASSTCTFTNCSGNTCTLSCRADIFFHADATDVVPYEGEEWTAFLEVSDTGGGYDFASPVTGVELQTLRYMTVDTGINYGSLAVTENTGAYNPTTTISNLGNVAFNLEVSGSNLTDGGSSVIPANKQKFASTTFTYNSCISCSLVSTSTPVVLALGITKPTVATPPVSAPIYWGIEVPLGVASVPHQGINYFTPVSP